MGNLAMARLVFLNNTHLISLDIQCWVPLESYLLYCKMNIRDKTINMALILLIKPIKWAPLTNKVDNLESLPIRCVYKVLLS